MVGLVNLIIVVGIK